MKTPDYYIAETLSPSIARGNLVDVAKVIDEKLHELDAASILVLLYPRIDELDSELVDALAIALHVDYYDASLPLDKRRALVKNSTRWHMRKGTKGIVQETVATVWDGCEVQEWFDYGGEPYHFKVVNITAAHVDEDVIREVLRAISATKNVRSWLDGIDFLRRITAPVYVGAVFSQHRSIRIGPKPPEDVRIEATIHHGAALSEHRHITVRPRLPEGAMVETTVYRGAALSTHRRIAARPRGNTNER